jgi:hypothetical protein
VSGYEGREGGEAGEWQFNSRTRQLIVVVNENN